MKAYNLDTAHAHRDDVTELYLHHCGLTTFPSLVLELPNLRVLEISRNALDALPAGIARLGRLERLVLAENRLRGLPGELAALTRLQALDLSGNALTEWPPVLFALPNLHELSLAGNAMKVIPPDIAALGRLRELDLSENRIGRLPAALKNLTGLRRLLLRGNRLATLPPALSALRRLRSLDLGHNRLRELPAALPPAWPELRELSLARNRLRELPPSLAACRELRRLNLNRNQLAALPPGFGDLPWLTDLHLNRNRLRTLPGAIAGCRRLQRLDLSYNELTSLPSTMADLPRLDELRLDHNQLSTLPLLPDSLRLLTVAHNRLSAVPPAVPALTGLRTLDLGHNRLSTLPPGMHALQALQHLLVQGNPLEAFPEVLLYLDELTQYRGPHLPAAEKAYLARFRRACRKDGTPAELRPALFRAGRGEVEVLAGLTLRQLFHTLGFGLHDVALAARAHLIAERGLPLARHPLQAGAGVALLGDAPFDRSRLRAQLEALGLSLRPTVDAATTHIVVDLHPADYEAALHPDRFVFLGPGHLRAFLDRAAARPLTHVSSGPAVDRLRQLLLHPQSHNVRLAAQLMQGGGVPPDLLTELFLAWKRAPRGKLKDDLRRLLESNLPETDRPLLSRRYPLHTGLPAGELEKNIRKYTEGTSLDADRMRRALRGGG